MSATTSVLEAVKHMDLNANIMIPPHCEGVPSKVDESMTSERRTSGQRQAWGQLLPVDCGEQCMDARKGLVSTYEEAMGAAVKVLLIMNHDERRLRSLDPTGDKMRSVPPPARQS